MRNIKVQFIGVDVWDRNVFKATNMEGLFLKKYPNDNTFYVAYGFNGEPEHPLNQEKYKVEIINEKERLR